jgi:hypothetical protein
LSGGCSDGYARLGFVVVVVVVAVVVEAHKQRSSGAQVLQAGLDSAHQRIRLGALPAHRARQLGVVGFQRGQPGAQPRVLRGHERREVCGC